MRIAMIASEAVPFAQTGGLAEVASSLAGALDPLGQSVLLIRPCENRARRAGLPRRPEVPLLTPLSRLDPQKGWDLLVEVADLLLERDVQLVVLGEGQPNDQERLEPLARTHDGTFHAFLTFRPPRAHQTLAGADMALLPRLYEPCDLSQLDSENEGTVPIVRATGGLADTVVDAGPSRLAEGTATGFVFREPTPLAVWNAIQRALKTFRDRALWPRLIVAGMRADWSWRRSAKSYIQLVEEIVRRRLSLAV